jgi:hypothetical protein
VPNRPVSKRPRRCRLTPRCSGQHPGEISWHRSVCVDPLFLRSATQQGQTKDLVAVTTRITSAGARSFQLLDVRMFKVSSANATLESSSSLPVSGFKKNFAVGSVIDEGESDRPLTLHPGDSIEVVGWTSVGRSEILPIKVVVLGLASTALAREQWVSAAVSIPHEPESKQEKSKP